MRWDRPVAEGLVTPFRAVQEPPQPKPKPGSEAERAWVEGLQRTGRVSALTAHRLTSRRLAAENCDVVSVDQILPSLAHIELWGALGGSGDLPALVVTPLADPGHALTQLTNGSIRRLADWLDHQRPGWAFAVLSPYWIRWKPGTTVTVTTKTETETDNSDSSADLLVGELLDWSGVSAYLVSPRGASLAARYGTPLELSVQGIMRVIGTEGHGGVYGVTKASGPDREPRLRRREPFMREHFIPLADDPEITAAPYEPVLPSLENLCVGLLVAAAVLAVVLAVLAVVLVLVRRKTRVPNRDGDGR